MNKVKTLFTTLLVGLVSFSTFSQNIEVDDIYFNSKDRAKLNEKKASAEIARFKRSEEQDALNSTINPTDSYSARNINPEYNSQSILDSDLDYGNEDYFVPNYQPSGINQNLSNSTNWNSPYYNNYYNPYGYNPGFGSYYPSMWGSPYSYNYSPGWNMSLGYGWGGWNPGWYSSIGYGWGNYSSPWNSYYNGWGGNYYGYGYYPSQVVIVNGGDNYSRVAYGKRPSRSSTVDHQVDRSRSQASYSRGDQTNSGRTRSATPSYYERGWKRNPETNPTRSFWSNNNSNNRSTFSTFGNNNNDAGRQRSTGFSSPTPTRSFNTGTSSPSRSSSSGSSGTRSSSSSGTRGRNN